MAFVEPVEEHKERFDSDGSVLPPNWREVKDGATGRVYYWDTDTGVTTWERPAPRTPPRPTSSTPLAPPPGNFFDPPVQERDLSTRAFTSRGGVPAPPFHAHDRIRR